MTFLCSSLLAKPSTYPLAEVFPRTQVSAVCRSYFLDNKLVSLCSRSVTQNVILVFFLFLTSKVPRQICYLVKALLSHTVKPHHYGHRWDYRVSLLSGLILRKMYGAGPRKQPVITSVCIKRVSVKWGFTVFCSSQKTPFTSCKYDVMQQFLGTSRKQANSLGCSHFFFFSLFALVSFIIKYKSSSANMINSHPFLSIWMCYR